MASTAAAVSPHGYVFKGKSYKQLLRDGDMLKIYMEIKKEREGAEEISIENFKNTSGNLVIPGGKKGFEFLEHFINDIGILLPGGIIVYSDETQYDLDTVTEVLHFIGYADRDEVISKMIHDKDLLNLSRLNSGHNNKNNPFRNYRGAPSMANNSSEANTSSEGNWASESNSSLEGFNLSKANLRAISRAKKATPTKKSRAARRRASKGKTRKSPRGKKRHSPSH